MASCKDLLFRVGTSLHKTVLRATGGRLGGRAAGMPVVLLTTIGRRTGERRATVLTAPIREAGRMVLVASYGGDNRHPSWFMNLQQNPDVEVTVGGCTTAMRARVASSEEKAQLWPRVIGRYQGYERYQERSERDIPLVILECRR